MTTPELRIAPDGRVAAQTHRLAGGGEWAVVAGPDASWLTRPRPTAAEVETWTPLVPAVAGTIPDDAAERLRKLAEEFRSLSDQSVVDALAEEPAEDECDSPAECHGAAACWTWKLAARQVEKLAESLATPTAGPAPAAADVQWGVQRADGVLDQRDDEDDARDHLTWFDAGTAEVVNRTVVYGPWQTAAPQVPAQPTAKNQCAYCTNPCEPGYSACEYHVGQISLYGLEGLVARPDEYGENVIVPNLAKPTKED